MFPLTSANALEILKDYDVIIDGDGQFPDPLFWLTTACVLLGKAQRVRQHLPL